MDGNSSQLTSKLVCTMAVACPPAELPVAELCLADVVAGGVVRGAGIVLLTLVCERETATLRTHGASTWKERRKKKTS